MNIDEEWDRISNLDIGSVKVELSKFTKEKKLLKPGANSGINGRIVMLQARLRELDARV